MRSISVRHLPTTLAVALCLACGGGTGDPTSPQAQVVGTYTLQTADGKTVPATVQQDPTLTIEVLGGSATIDANGTCSIKLSYRGTGSDGSVMTADPVQTCTWQLSGATLGLRWSDNTTSTASFTGGNTLALSQDGYADVFKK